MLKLTSDFAAHPALKGFASLFTEDGVYHDVFYGDFKGHAKIAQMIDAWKQGDADRLAQLMNEEDDAPELMELLLYNRNRAWAEWIKARLNRPGTVFMAVGAGHLAGAGSGHGLCTHSGAVLGADSAGCVSDRASAACRKLMARATA